MNTDNLDYQNTLEMGKIRQMESCQALDLAIIALESRTGQYYRQDRRGKLYRDVIRLNIRAIRSLRAMKGGKA